MNIGFKTGPKNFDVGKRIVQDEGGSMCEVWYRVDRPNEYTEMFDWLLQNNVQIGLHHWGLVDGKYKTNMASADDYVWEVTFKQIQEVIDLAASMSAAYVNIHPGAAGLETFDMDQGAQALVPNSLTSREESKHLAVERSGLVSAYAQEREVLLTIETLPGIEMQLLGAREETYDPLTVQLDVLSEIAVGGSFIANDITHTLGSLQYELKRDDVWEEVLAFSREVAAQTRLLHINTVRPPFNGTDSHNGLLEEDWNAGVMPSRDRLKDFLRIFKDRDDVFVVPEPDERMLENYIALRELVNEVVV